MKKDLLFTFRTLIRNPGVSLIVILTLAIGIGANTAIFSLVSPYIFRGLPFPDAHQLVHLYQVDPKLGQQGRFSLPQFRDWKEQAQSYQDLALYDYLPLNIAQPGEEPEQVMTARMTVNLLPMLGAKAAHGRVFQESEGASGQGDVAILSDALWKGRFGGRREVLGETVSIGGKTYEIIGVMASDFFFPYGEVKMWIPFHLDQTGEQRSDYLHLMVGRLKPGTSIGQARSEASLVHQRLREAHPDAEGKLSGMHIVPLKEGLLFFYDIIKLLMLLLLGIVGLALLIVVANVANIMLARAGARASEVAIRLAHGCSAKGIIRLFLLESLTLAIFGGLLGVVLAYQVAKILARSVPEALYRVGEVRIDGAALLFTLGVCLVAALIFGLAPALSSLRIRIVDTLKEGGAKGSGGIRKRRLQTFLVGFQITIAVVLLTSAFFMIQSIRSMQTSDFGFELDSVQTLQISLPQNRYGDAAQRRNYFDQAVREVRAISGVEAAAAILPLPLNQTTLTMDFRVDGQPLAPGERLFANQMSITPGFFETMKVPLRRGRVFSDADNDTGEPVIVINETMANRFWQGGDAVGRRVWLIQRGEEKAVTVVGVVADIRHRVEWQEGDEIWPQIYRPWGQAPRSLAHLVVRGRNVDALLPALRRTIYSIDAAVPIETPRSMREVAQESFQPIQIVSSVLGLLAIVAMTLAAVGIYGIVAYTLSRRLREIGIRMALGSSPSMIIRLILKQGLIYAVFGGLIGMLVAFAALTALKSALAGLADLSPILFVGVALFVAVVALIASFFPARRAAGLSPVFMLRQE